MTMPGGGGGGGGGEGVGEEARHAFYVVKFYNEC